MLIFTDFRLVDRMCCLHVLHHPCSLGARNILQTCLLSPANGITRKQDRQIKAALSVYRRYSQEILIQTYLFTLPTSCPLSKLIVFIVKFYCVNYLEVCYQKISPVSLYLKFYRLQMACQWPVACALFQRCLVLSCLLPCSYTTLIGRIREQEQGVW